MRVRCIVDKGWPLPGLDTTFNHPAKDAVRLSCGDVREVDENDENIKEAIAKGYLEEVIESAGEVVQEEE